jgi:hypothetical protein
MKLTKIIEAITLKNNKWQMIPTSELELIKQEILNLINTAYNPIGGHPDFKNTSDISGDNLFTVIDIDDDQDPDAVTVSKKRTGGEKLVAIGHDGTKDAKRVVIQKKTKTLKTRGHYIEVSGRIKDILVSNGVPIVDDEETVRKILQGKDIKWNGNGTYDRHIDGLGTVTKTMMGKPRV